MNYLVVASHNSHRYIASVHTDADEAYHSQGIWQRRLTALYEARRKATGRPGAKPVVKVYAEVEINPEWVAAGKKGVTHYLYDKTAFTAINIGPEPAIPTNT